MATTAEVEMAPTPNERAMVVAWRSAVLERAGYDAKTADVLAQAHEVDLHLASDLLERGCPLDTALRILL